MTVTYQNIEIECPFDPKESEAHLEHDFHVLEEYGIDRLILERWIPWLKTEEFRDMDDRKIYEGLRLTSITYSFGRIIAKYSPTKQDDMFGQFEFDFESSNDYTADLLEACAMEVFVKGDEIVRVSGFEI